MKQLTLIAVFMIAATSVFSQANIYDAIHIKARTKFQLGSKTITDIQGSGLRIVSGALEIDTFKIATRAWRQKLADSLAAIFLPSASAASTYLPLAGGTLTGTLNARNVLASTDNTYDIGTSGANRYRDFYLARNAVINGTTTIGNSGVTAGTNVLNVITPTVSGSAGSFNVTNGTNAVAGNTKVTVNGYSFYGLGGVMSFGGENPVTAPISFGSSYPFTPIGWYMTYANTISGSNQSIHRTILGGQLSSSEYTTGASYPSTVNYYITQTYLNSTTTATNTGATAVRPPIYVDARTIRWFTGNTSPISLSGAANAGRDITPAAMLDSLGNYLLGMRPETSGYTTKAKLQFQAGTTTVAPIKFNAGTNLTTPENGAVEYDGTDYFVTSGGTRYKLSKSLTGSVTWDIPSLATGNSDFTTATVTGAAVGDQVVIGFPATVTVQLNYIAYVSTANTVTLYVTNNNSGTFDPANLTYTLRVIKQ